MWGRKRIMEGRKRKIRFLRVLLLAAIAVCLFQIGRIHHLSAKYDEQQERLRELKTAKDGAGDTGTTYVKKVMAQQNRREEAVSEKEDAGEEAVTVIMDKYAALYEENNDLVGWLSIEGMVIDYPVMQCEDDEYYLHHDYYGNDSRYGCLYVRGTADIHTPGTNFVIYGHNMKDGSMFGDLDLYREEDFYREHPVISFDTLYEERSYEIVAVFLSQVYAQDEDTFKYYQFYQADTQEEFDYFYGNIKELALYDTEVTAEYGDTFLTLSTCAYHVQDGRLTVVAKRL